MRPAKTWCVTFAWAQSRPSLRSPRRPAGPSAQPKKVLPGTRFQASSRNLTAHRACQMRQSWVKATQDAIKKLNPVIFLEDVSTGLKIQKLQPQPITMDGLWLVDETNTETEVHVEANHD